MFLEASTIYHVRPVKIFRKKIWV